ncbi:unnamed protein product [Calypogeia fissa]
MGHWGSSIDNNNDFNCHLIALRHSHKHHNEQIDTPERNLIVQGKVKRPQSRKSKRDCETLNQAATNDIASGRSGRRLMNSDYGLQWNHDC